MKQWLKKLIPQQVLQLYHRLFARFAAALYRHPSRKLIVVGVTGTNGKSTTVNLIGRILEEAGHKVGWTSTMNFKIGDREWLNDMKMTMPGRLWLQRMLRQMVDVGCTHAVIETSSEGIAQFRHIGIDYDVAVFTNLTPEHIESHGSFDNYKRAKLKLFEAVEGRRNKVIDGRPVKRGIVVNADDPHAKEFVAFGADDRIAVGVQREGESTHAAAFHDQCRVMTASVVELGEQGSHFQVYDVDIRLKLLGIFNVSNAALAIAATKLLGVPVETAARALEKVSGVPGRVEFIEEGQPFKVLVDYAPEPVSLGKLYELLAFIPHKRLIHVLGSAGGGRDKARRPILGHMAAEHADVVIVTNEDPYDEPPMDIIRGVAVGAAEALRSGKPCRLKTDDLYRILDRGEALKLAISLAEPGDLVLATGKGSEQAICVAKGRKVPWDEREELRKAIRNRHG